MGLQHPQCLVQHPAGAGQQVGGAGVACFGGDVDGGADGGGQRSDVVEPGAQADITGGNPAVLADQLRRSLGSAAQLDHALGQFVSLLA